MFMAVSKNLKYFLHKYQRASVPGRSKLRLLFKRGIGCVDGQMDGFVGE
jgi:hypothetical protein